MSGTLTGKSGIVAGGSRGIGAAIAKRLGKEGANVLLTYAGEVAKAQEVVNAIEATGVRAIAVQADSSNNEQVTRAFDTAQREFRAIDFVINVAGSSIFKPLAEFSDTDFEKMIAVNVRGAFYVLRAAAKQVVDGGRILHFSTGGTITPMAAGGVYAGTKAAGERMALSLAKELGHRGVSVNTVSPGVTETDGLVMPQQALEQLKSQTPLGRLGQPEDLADAVVLLLSHDSRWVNGQNIQINGGLQ